MPGTAIARRHLHQQLAFATEAHRRPHSSPSLVDEPRVTLLVSQTHCRVPFFVKKVARDSDLHGSPRYLAGSPAYHRYTAPTPHRSSERRHPSVGCRRTGAGERALLLMVHYGLAQT